MLNVSTDPSAVMSRETSPFVEARNVHACYGKLEVLKGIDFNLGEGEVAVLIGASGSGKSTLLRCIIALHPIDKGEIHVGGTGVNQWRDDCGTLHKDSARSLCKKRSMMGMVFQHFALFSHLTTLENVMLGPTMVRGFSKSDARELALTKLAEVGLGDKIRSYPAHLSGGQKQRVGIARALAMEPTLMLFDEPTSALDPELVGGILSIMERLAEEGMTMIVVTHELSFAKAVGTKMSFLHEGKIIEEASPASMIESPQTEAAQHFLRQVLV
ncbi:amino acid ABC transporter ATP-binding protein [Candidatus Bipolaricaulota bacterium]